MARIFKCAASPATKTAHKPLNPCIKRCFLFELLIYASLFNMNKKLYELSYSVRKEFHRRIVYALTIVMLIFLTVNFILAFLIFPVRQRSVSMLPDIHKNSCMIFSPLIKSYKRGDIILVRPLQKNSETFFSRAADVAVRFFTAQQIGISHGSTNMGNSFLVRRIIGMPGDTVYMRDYIAYIKPEGEKSFLTEFELIRKKYDVEVLSLPPMWDSSIGVMGNFESIVLGKDEYLVLGDNRNSCVDSRLWGAIKKSDLYAYAVIMYFPPQEIKLL